MIFRKVLVETFAFFHSVIRTTIFCLKGVNKIACDIHCEFDKKNFEYRIPIYYIYI